MRNDRLVQSYFEWLCSLVSSDPSNKYSQLLNTLFDISFEYIDEGELSKDQNRAYDGIDLRDLYAYENDLDRASIPNILTDILGDARVLEVIIALARRIDDVLYDPENPPKTDKYFWVMIRNLGLFDQNNRHFDVKIVNDHVYKWMNREYNGYGKPYNLFKFRHHLDVDKFELWYQMHRWTSENYPDFFEIA